jgi:hypothetical protein
LAAQAQQQAVQEALAAQAKQQALAAQAQQQKGEQEILAAQAQQQAVQEALAAQAQQKAEQEALALAAQAKQQAVADVAKQDALAAQAQEVAQADAAQEKEAEEEVQTKEGEADPPRSETLVEEATTTGEAEAKLEDAALVEGEVLAPPKGLEGGPASSSSAAPMADDVGAALEAAAPQELSAGSKRPDKAPDDEPGAKRVKRFKSPAEILEKLQPPGCKLTLGFNDHRWSSTWEEANPLLPGKLKQRYFSKRFGLKLTWQEALKEVHKHNWEKWGLVKHDFPLPRGEVEQTPGDIPEETLAQLKPAIDTLPPLVRYG